MKFTNDGNILCEEISVDNVGLFRAVLMINIIVKLDSIVSVGEDAFANCVKLKNITFSSALVGDSLNIAAFADSVWYRELKNMQEKVTFFLLFW